MGKRIFEALVTAVLLAALLAGCTGYGDHSVYRDSATAAENLALGRNALAFTESGNGKNASKAVDGNEGTGCFMTGTSGTIEVDLGEKQTFNTVVLRERGWNVRYFHLEVLNEKDQWETVYQAERIEGIRYCALEAPVTTSKLRLVVDRSNQAFTIAEITVTNEQAVRDREDFFVTAYVRTEFMQSGELFDPASSNYLEPEYFNSVNEINFLGSVSLNADGTISVTKSTQDAEGKAVSVPSSAEELAQAVARMRAHFGDRDVQLTMTVNTANHDEAYQAMSDYKDEQVKNTMAFLEATGFDGVSYDWERPQNQDQFNAFSDYLIALRPELTAKGKRLTLAWAAWGVNMKEEAVKTADAIEIMSYDLFDQYGNQASFMESTVQAVDYFLDLGYAPEQLHIGLPYYGRPDNGAEEWPLYDNMNYHFGKYADADTDYLAEGLSYFNSYQTVADKTAYAISKGLGGIMVFRLELDRPYKDEDCLTKSIENMLDQRTVKEGAKA